MREYYTQIYLWLTVAFGLERCVGFGCRVRLRFGGQASTSTMGVSVTGI